MKKQQGYVSAELVIAAIVIIGFVGWISNIIKLIYSDFDPLTGMVVGRVIGIFFAPLGAILGYF